MLARASLVSPLLLITSLQPLYFLAITHSFAERRTNIPNILNSLRTLSITTGVVPPATSVYPVYLELGGEPRRRVFRTPCSLRCAFSLLFRTDERKDHRNRVSSMNPPYIPPPQFCSQVPSGRRSPAESP